MPVRMLDYKPPIWLRNPHVNTIYASFRNVRGITLQPSQERIQTPDDDEFYADWYRQGSQRLLIISHGLEGNSRRPYMLGMVDSALKRDWDVAAWNYRSCSGTPNKKLTSYHSGSTDDLAHLVDHATKRGYHEIALCGFSIGGNKTLLYLSRDQHLVPPQVTSAVTFSVPCDLVNSSVVLAEKRNRIYMRNFLKTLEEKLRQKQRLFPGDINLDGYSRIKTFAEFDERYTAPMNGFDSALDYWTKSSCLPHLSKIELPVALLTSLDDPFLSASCFPFDIARENPNFHLLVTEKGGHVGFVSKGREYFSEREAMAFLESH